MLIYIPHFGGNILFLHPSLDKKNREISLISRSMEPFHERKSLFLYFIDRLACHSSVYFVSESDLFMFFVQYSTVRPMFCSCLHKHWLKWKLQQVTLESESALFISLTTAASKPSFLILCDRQERRFFSRVSNNDMLFLFYPVKVLTEPYICTFNAVYEASP